MITTIISIVLFCCVVHLNWVITHRFPRRQLSLGGSLIIGGRSVSIRQYPYAVSINAWSEEYIESCGGTVLNTKYVLTAAHCFLDPPLFIIVSVGSTMIQQAPLYNTTLYKIHPQFNVTTMDYDVALVITTTTMILDGVNSKPVVLAETGTSLVPGTPVTVVGWGYRNVNGTAYSPHLEAVQVEILNQEVCQKIYTEMNGETDITPRMFCIGNLLSGGKDGCIGDSGGPAVTSDGVQVGIVSWGVSCGHPQNPGIYTNVASVRSWVRSVAGV